eukprot:2878515-Amphidinium_carterae.1
MVNEEVDARRWPGLFKALYEEHFNHDALRHDKVHIKSTAPGYERVASCVDSSANLGMSIESFVVRHCQEMELPMKETRRQMNVMEGKASLQNDHFVTHSMHLCKKRLSGNLGLWKITWIALSWSVQVTHLMAKNKRTEVVHSAKVRQQTEENSQMIEDRLPPWRQKPAHIRFWPQQFTDMISATCAV